ncbi:MAG TPA: sodium/solute symporter [Puia sp.]|uniref:sodium:solute symporter family transporter n=1 Tax=Puia sp. TaxID=2045100 RepID=UPI002CE5BFD3|nr:sodium/solute symporter [Puia sp.]HVU98293.1 sodium/solute symporter [Puia sp.]
MNRPLSIADILIIVFFLTLTLYLGLRHARRKQSTQSFFLAKGKIPAWAIGMSLLASMISSVTFLAYPGEGYSSNWILLVQGLMVPVVLLGIIWFVVPLYRKVIGLSTYEYFEKRFGVFARYYSSLAFVLRQFSAMGTIFFLLALALSKMLGWNTTGMIVAIGTIIVVINLLGGIEAVIWLDVFQGFMLFASGITCLLILLFTAAPSPAKAVRIAAAAHHTGFGPYTFDFTHLTFLVMAINGVFYAIQKYGTDQTVVQRYLTARTDKAAIRASLMGVLLTVPIWMLFMFIGTGLFVYYQSHPLPPGTRADAVFPYFIMTRLPTGLVGFILSAMTSAAICSMSADLNSLGAVGVEDYYKKIRPNQADNHYLRAGKVIVTAAGLISIGIAMLYVNAGSGGVLGIVFSLYAIFSGGISGIFLLGLLSPRTNRQGINIGIIACILFTAYAFLTSTKIGLGGHQALLLDLGRYNFTHHTLMLGVYSHLIVIVVGYLASLFFPKPVLDPNLLFSGWRKARKLVPIMLLTTVCVNAQEPWKRSFQKGVEALDHLSSQYNNKSEWELRRATLQSCLYQALDLNPLPPKLDTPPITTPWRKKDGYEVANVAIELIPGLYINGSLYKPLKIKGRIPVILNPDGHFEHHRYRPDCQIRCAAEARMGAMAFSYDLFGWNESLLQFKPEDHRTPLAQTIQILGGIRALDYLLSLPEADKERVGVTGASGGGTQTILLTALDDRIKVSAPVVMVSAYFDGGCPCEHGRPIHVCAGGTDNVEIAAMAAPRPQLLVSDGHDWTAHMPEHDFPYLQRIYGYLGDSSLVENVHLPTESHDYGPNKRIAMYHFMAKRLGLNLKAIQHKDGSIDESRCAIEPDSALFVFGPHGEDLPADAIMGFDNLQRAWAHRYDPRPQPQQYKVAVVDLMLLKRQKLGAIPLARTVGADGLEVDMGGLGSRETFENSLANDSIRRRFLETAQADSIEFCSLALTGFYSQNFATRPTYQKNIADAIAAMKGMHIRIAFLPLGVNADPGKHPEWRDSLIRRLKIAGKMAEQAGVVIGIETTLPAVEELKLLKAIGSPAIKSYFNFANALDAKRDLNQELKTLGRDNICQIHCTNTDGVWLQNDPAIDMKKVKAMLDEMGYSGWLVIERSRDARDPHNVKKNFRANTHYVQSVFQPGATIEVSPNGKTLSTAFREARELRRLADPSAKHGIHILLKGGEYQLTEPLFLRPEDSGSPNSPTIIEASPGETPIISGATSITAWRKSTGNLWEADVNIPFRELWVNGVKAVRARDVDDDDLMPRIRAVDKAEKAIYIPAIHTLPTNPGNMEMVIHQMWATAILRVKTIEKMGDRYKLTFKEPESHLEFEHPWPAPVLDSAHKQNGSSAYYLVNAPEFLDHPGEWYNDETKGKLYYWPRPGEDINTAQARIPALTNLLVTQGTPDNPVHDIQFKGIQFSYTGWLRPSEKGHVPLQAGMYLLDAYKLKIPGTPGKKGLENQAWIGRPASAVEISYTHHLLFDHCIFTHLASTGLDFIRGTYNDSTTRCRFQDIGGTALQLGVYSDPAFETHLPYNPQDPREVCHDEWITDNTITDCTNEDWGTVGISAGYVHDVHIGHNEVSEVSYSGICVGWGWTRTINCMHDNHIIGNYVHHYGKHMFDVGGIYTLSAQPGTLIMDNRIDSIYHPPYAHDLKHWFYFYFDEGSSFITIKDNWCPAEKFMHNANGPGNTWENNGPQVAEIIKQAAGPRKI